MKRNSFKWKRSKSSPEKPCPSAQSCPLLGGESPQKVLKQRTFLRKRVTYLEGLVEYGSEQVIKLRNEIKEIKDENEHLKNDLSDALQAPFKKLKKREPPENPKKRGAPFGHPGKSRKNPGKIDKHIHVYIDKCPVCGNQKLSLCKHSTKHTQEDIDSVKSGNRPEATCFIHHYYWCSVCKKTVHGWGKGEVPGAYIGPTTRAASSFLRYEIKISYDDVQRVLLHLGNLEITSGSIVGFDNKLSANARPLYDKIKRSLRHTPFIHADETGWMRYWLWVFTNPLIAFYHIDEHRSSDVVIDHLGEYYRGILHSDCYPAYNTRILCFAKQKCCSHLLKDIKNLLKDLSKDKKNDNTDAEAFLNKLKLIIQDAIRLHSEYSDEMPRDEWRTRKRKIKSRFRKLYNRDPVLHTETETLRERIIKHKYEIFTFLIYPDKAFPTNNFAEQSLRNLVIFRKITFGSQSDQGRRNVSIIATVIRTAKLQKLNPVKIIWQLVTEGVTPQFLDQFTLPKPRPP